MNYAELYRAPVSANNALGDPYRMQNRVRCKIVIDCLSMVVGDGVTLRRGANVADIPEVDVPRLKTMVRDARRWQMAEEARTEQLAAWRKENGNRPEPYALSVEAVYRSMFRKDPGSILEFEILQENIAPPMTEDDRRLAALHAKTIESLRDMRDDSDSDDDVTPAPRRRGRPPKSQD